MEEVLIAINEVKEIVQSDEGQADIINLLDSIDANLETSIMKSEDIYEETLAVNEHLEQIDATLKIFFVGACIIVFSKLFINTFFKGW